MNRERLASIHAIAKMSAELRPELKKCYEETVAREVSEMAKTKLKPITRNLVEKDERKRLFRYDLLERADGDYDEDD